MKKIILAALLLSSCARTQYLWDNPNVPHDAQGHVTEAGKAIHQDNWEECVLQANKDFPEGLCPAMQTPDYSKASSPAQAMAMGMAAVPSCPDNSDLRDMAFKRCMKSKGWTLMEKSKICPPVCLSQPCC